jgi:hypothetical protein
MQTALRLETTVLPGHRLEVSAPELPEGAKVEVIVLLPDKPEPQFGSALEFLESLPPGPRAFEAHRNPSRRGGQRWGSKTRSTLRLLLSAFWRKKFYHKTWDVEGSRASRTPGTKLPGGTSALGVGPERRAT